MNAVHWRRDFESRTTACMRWVAGQPGLSLWRRVPKWHKSQARLHSTKSGEVTCKDCLRQIRRVET